MVLSYCSFHIFHLQHDHDHIMKRMVSLAVEQNAPPVLYKSLTCRGQEEHSAHHSAGQQNRQHLPVLVVHNVTVTLWTTRTGRCCRSTISTRPPPAPVSPLNEYSAAPARPS